MVRQRIFAAILCAGMAVTPDSVIAQASFGFNLHATVPLQCNVRHVSAEIGADNSSAIALGVLREYCNAPNGYRVIVSYSPGSLRGATLSAGSDSIVLDGSGHAVLSEATGPRVRERDFAIVLGESGFDTDQLHVDIIPA